MAYIELQVTVDKLSNDELDTAENDLRRFLANYKGNGKVVDVSETDRETDLEDEELE